MAKKVLCRCSKCSKKTVVENSQTLPGQNVSSGTRQEHLDKDTKLEAAAAVNNPVPVVGPNTEPDDDRISVPALGIFETDLLLQSPLHPPEFKPQIEEQLEKTFQKDQARQNAPQVDVMRDIQDSPAWRSLGNYLLSRYHLVFGFHIDWFNLYTNKITGSLEVDAEEFTEAEVSDSASDLEDLHSEASDAHQSPYPGSDDQMESSSTLYRAALPKLFPIPKFSSVPNHHFAMHNGKLLKFWGPLPGVNDTPGSMLTQVTHRGRLEAQFSDGQLKDGHAGHLAEILKPDLAAQTKATQPLTELEVVKNLAKAEGLSEDDYEMLLQDQASKGQPWRSCYQLLHPPGSLILPPCAMKPLQFKLGKQGFSCYKSLRGNSGIQFHDPSDNSVQTGFINEIWEIPFEGHMQTFVLVQKHKNLPLPLFRKTPFPSFPLFQATVVDVAESNQFCIIEPRHILTHVTVFTRPKGTYGIDRKIVVICWALNRGRRKFGTFLPIGELVNG
ncbi:hypothetical protein DFH09DRAFT_1109599 [Mycena vulgaris]|nr:hypothetical protein DFH09DRAFT_1109599 [Mycena vulgaris]